MNTVNMATAYISVKNKNVHPLSKPFCVLSHTFLARIVDVLVVMSNKSNYFC